MPIANGITFKIFIGCLITSELRAALNRSSKWKEFEILGSQSQAALQKIPFEDKQYLGKYLPSPFLYLKEIPSLEKDFFQNLAEFCPEYRQEKLSLRIFSQAFIH